MTATLIIFRRELRAALMSPATHLVATVYFFLQGMAFTLALQPFFSTPQARSLSEAYFQGPLFWIPSLAIIPLLTMRLFAEEQKMGTMEMLLSAPIRLRDVVAGKFLAIAVVFAGLNLPTAAFFLGYPPLLGQTPIHPAHGFWAAWSLALAIGLMNLAAGCLCSALTTSQLGAGVLTFGALLGHLLLGALGGRLGNLSPPVHRFFDHIHSENHLRLAAGGLWNFAAMVYPVSLALLLLAATGFALHQRRWKS